MASHRLDELAAAIFESKQPAIRLRALELLATQLVDLEGEHYLRLEREAPQLPPPLDEAAARALLLIRREARRNDVRTGIIERVAGAGKKNRNRMSESLMKLSESMRSSDEQEVIERIHELVDTECFGASPTLATRLMVERKPAIAAALARAAGYLGGEGVTIPLKKASRSENPTIRIGAIEGLRYQDTLESTRLLLERLADTDPEVRGVAELALESRSPEALIEVLEKIPDGRCLEIMREAVKLLTPWAGEVIVQRFLRGLVSHADLQVVARVGAVLYQRQDQAWPDLEARLQTWPGDRARKVLDLIHTQVGGTR